MHRGHSEVGFPHFLCQPFHLPLGVTEDDCLSNGQSVVEITQGVKLPLLFLNGHKELLDTLQGQFITVCVCVCVMGYMCNGLRIIYYRLTRI